MHEPFHVEIPEYSYESLKALAEAYPEVKRGPMLDGLSELKIYPGLYAKNEPDKPRPIF